jgi:methyltransferase
VNFTAFVVAAVVGLLLAETRVSSLNARRLETRGAARPPGDVYAAMAFLYPAAFLLMGAEGIWRALHTDPLSSGGPAWPASGVVLFVASKALKYWAIATLGERWTFRVYVLPGLPLLRHGPYRYVAHPNYVAVIGELAGTAMMMRAAITGPVMLLLFGAALLARIRFENRVHREHGAT